MCEHLSRKKLWNKIWCDFSWGKSIKKKLFMFKLKSLKKNHRQSFFLLLLMKQTFEIFSIQKLLTCEWKNETGNCGKITENWLSLLSVVFFAFASFFGLISNKQKPESGVNFRRHRHRRNRMEWAENTPKKKVGKI